MVLQTKPVGFDQFFIGFDSIFDRIITDHQKLQRFTGKYPPHNIKKIDDGIYAIELAVAGFTEEEIDIMFENGIITVKGTPKERKGNYIFQGIANREFEKQFALNEEVKIIDANMINGFLVINLERIIPDHKKPRKIPLGKTDKQLLAE